ncbi:MAG TPA: helix-hairpin-helix domain-containing protein [Deltaproteobacteria bacterium]|nr:helix-hairpin-helix domain-containing protein [Deltaproteobacteria bacterium]
MAHEREGEVSFERDRERGLALLLLAALMAVTAALRSDLPRRAAVWFFGPSPSAGVRSLAGPPPVPGVPIDINSAGIEELVLLPGIGYGLAGAIVAERARRGGFGSVGELLYVRGIGASRLRALEGLVFAGSRQSPPFASPGSSPP